MQRKWDKPPQILSRVLAEYTAAAREKKIEGLVRLSVVIRADGSIGEVELVDSLDPGLDQKAIAAVQQWRCEPAQLDGEAVAAAATIEIAFQLPRSGPAPERPTIEVG